MTHKVSIVVAPGIGTALSVILDNAMFNYVRDTKVCQMLSVGSQQPYERYGSMWNCIAISSVCETQYCSETSKES